MANVFTFAPDDSLVVVDGITSRYSMTAEQAVKHDPMFRAEMSAPQRTRLDQIKQRLIDEAAAEAAAQAERDARDPIGRK